MHNTSASLRDLRNTQFDIVGISQPIWNIPTMLTPLVGREQDVTAVCTLLQRAEVRLLTLLGPGGIGKTRLGFQIATELQNVFLDGVCFVGLSTIHDPDQVIPTIAHTLGLREQSVSHFEQLKEFLREKHLLLLLDNIEQVIQAAPSLVSVLETCPGIKILVTSRVALRVQGEQRFIVAPLALPDLKQHIEKETIAQYASVALFLQRVRALVPGFDVTPANAMILAEICTRLDGLPLSIELAAAHIRLLPPHALLPRLARRLQILTRGASTLPARQQTLRNTIQWSYDLLNPWEQRIFRLFSVFAGGCTLEAIEALCTTLDNEADEKTVSILDGVDSLVEKSLLQLPVQREQGEEPRVHMLETIREYALEQLVTHGEIEATRQAHATYYLQFAEDVEPKLAGPEQAVWLDRLEQEHDNIRAALQWWLEQGEREHTLEKALQFGGILRRFWLVHGHLREGRAFLERALAGSRGAQTPIRGRALNAAANIALNQGDVDRAEVLAEEGLALYRALGETRDSAFSLHQLERVADTRGDLSTSRQLSEEALTLFKEVDDQERVAWSLLRLARLHRKQGEYARACTLAQESLSIQRALGNKEGVASALFQWAQAIFVSQGNRVLVRSYLAEALALYKELGDKEDMADCFSLSSLIALSEGDTNTAHRQIEESIALSREIGDQEGLTESLPLLARVLTTQKNYSAAYPLFEECLTVARKTNNKMNSAICLEGLANMLVAQAIEETSHVGTQSKDHSFLWAVQLWGKAESLREAISIPIPPVDRVSYESARAKASTQINAHIFARAWSEGREMKLEEVLEARTGSMDGSPQEALTSLIENTSTRGMSRRIQQVTPKRAKKAIIYPDNLTVREVEVLKLLAQGLSDAQIAGHLVISPRTVNTHLGSIYRKLHVTTRSAATRYALDHQLI